MIVSVDLETAIITIVLNTKGVSAACGKAANVFEVSFNTIVVYIA